MAQRVVAGFVFVGYACARGAAEPNHPPLPGSGGKGWSPWVATGYGTSTVVDLAATVVVVGVGAVSRAAPDDSFWGFEVWVCLRAEPPRYGLAVQAVAVAGFPPETVETYRRIPGHVLRDLGGALLTCPGLRIGSGISFRMPVPGRRRVGR